MVDVAHLVLFVSGFVISLLFANLCLYVYVSGQHGNAPLGSMCLSLTIIYSASIIRIIVKVATSPSSASVESLRLFWMGDCLAGVFSCGAALQCYTVRFANVISKNESKL